MTLSYVQKGSGKDLLFLHGYLASKECFTPHIEYFSRCYRVTALDFPGFGESEPLDTAYSVSDYADWTERVCAELNLQSPYVIAHSFGGRVAVKCLSRGNLFERAVLCGCAGIVPRRGLKYKMRVKTYRFVKKIAPRYAERKFGSSEYKTLSPVMRESYKKIVNEDLREDAKKIRIPVLFINGENDSDTPVSSAKIYTECVNDSKLYVMKGCSHFAFLQDPLAFRLAAEEFFQ